MDYPRIAVKVEPKAFNELIDLGNKLIVSLTGNLNFITISPPLASVQTAVTDLTNALAIYGHTGNRGSKEQYIDLCNKALNVHLIIKELAGYVQNTAGIAAGSDYALMASIISTSGFTLAKTKSPIGTLEAVRNFHQFISRSLAKNQVKLRWTRPLNTSKTDDVSIYEVLRSATPDFSAAVKVAIVTKGEFIDSNNSGSMVTSFYWIVGYNAAGAGVPSAMLAVTVLPA